MQKLMMNMWPTRLRIVNIFLVLVVGFFPLATQAIVAEAPAYQIASFDVDVQIQQDGSMDVTERLKVVFNELKHGIYRTIPLVYKVDDQTARVLKASDVFVTDAKGQPLLLHVTMEDWLSIRIGDPDATVIGQQEYVIHYQIDGALQSFDDHDELYWNVTGTEWEIPPQKASVQIHLPSSVDDGTASVDCFTGSLGSTNQKCTTQVDLLGATASTSNQFLTVVYGWPKGLVTVPAPVIEEGSFTSGSFVSDSQAETDNRFFFLTFLLPVATLVAMLLLWMRHGRDPRGRGTIVPEYDPPQDLRPTEIGFLMKERLHPNGFSAAIVDLAVRGHIKISEKIEERWGPDKKTYTLEKIVSADVLQPWEQQLVDWIFPGTVTIVEEQDLKTRLMGKRGPWEKQVAELLVSKGLFTKNPGQVRATWLLIAFAIGGVSFFSGPLQGGLFNAAWVVALFGWFMPRKTPAGVAAQDHAKGFKVFLNTAEKYRLEWQEKENVFERYLPYAMVFGVADKWAKTFKDLGMEPPQPSWYVGSFAAFNAMDFNNRLQAFSKSFATATAPKSSGFSGGSSGGGFGGGGGGSW